jgi:hypothetical protein
MEWLNFPEQQHLVRAFIVWFRRVLCPDASDEIPRIENLQEAKTILVENVAKWADEIRRESTKKAKKEGKKEGYSHKPGHFRCGSSTQMPELPLSRQRRWVATVST